MEEPERVVLQDGEETSRPIGVIFLQRFMEKEFLSFRFCFANFGFCMFVIRLLGEQTITKHTDLQIAPRNLTIGFYPHCQAYNEREVKNERALFRNESHTSIIGFLTTFKRACDTNHVHEEAAIWVLPHCVEETLANALNSCMCTEDRLSAFATSVRNEDTRSSRLLRSYAEVVIYR